MAIDFQHVTHVGRLPEHHRYPFDRLLVAQLILENMRLVNIDPQLDPYGIQRLW